MNKNDISLADIAKKHHSYVTNIDTLKEEVKKKSGIDEDSLDKTNHSVEPQKNQNNIHESKVIDVKNVNFQESNNSSVALHIPISQALRDRLKVKAITEGKKMKDVVVTLIENYLK